MNFRLGRSSSAASRLLEECRPLVHLSQRRNGRERNHLAQVVGSSLSPLKDRTY
eukprot:COSAG02_NODE_11231_length_1766_cov_0.896221_1_plen_53_part_10